MRSRSVAEAEPVSLRLVPLGGGRAGTDVVIAALTLFHGRADPLVLAPRRQVLIEGAAGELPTVDLGMAIQTRPLPSLADAGDDGALTGWGPAVVDASPSRGRTKPRLGPSSTSRWRPTRG